MKKINLVISTICFLFISACNAPSNTNLQDLSNNQADISSTKKDTKYSNFDSGLSFASSTARRWDISANLVKAESSWVDQNGNGFWTYYFKSPFKRTAYRVENGFGQEISDSFFGSQIYELNIRVSSDKAIEKAKAQGLKNFPVSSMTLENRYGYAEWQIMSSNGIFRINAENINSKVTKE